MASVFALIFVPAIIAIVGLMSSLGAGAGTIFGAAAFVLLAGGMFFGLIGLSKQWDQQPEH